MEKPKYPDEKESGNLVSQIIQQTVLEPRAVECARIRYLTKCQAYCTKRDQASQGTPTANFAKFQASQETQITHLFNTLSCIIYDPFFVSMHLLINNHASMIA